MITNLAHSQRWYLTVAMLGAALVASAASTSWAQDDAQGAATQTEAESPAAATPGSGDGEATEGTAEPSQPADTAEQSAVPAAAESTQPATADAAASPPAEPTSTPPAATQPTDQSTPSEPQGDAAAPASATPESAPVGSDPSEPATPAAPTAPEPVASGEATTLSAFEVIRILLILAVILVVPFLIGNALGRSLRMPDHAWRIGLSLCTIVAATAITILGWPPHLGPDLSGGVNLIYELDTTATENIEDVDMTKLIGAISQRINPGGVKEVTIRQYGQQQVEIIIPKADDAEIDLIKRKISTAGALEFRITADSNADKDVVALAMAQRAKGTKTITRDDRAVARWVRLNEKEFDPARDTHLVTRQNERGQWEILVLIDPWKVTGDYLSTSTSGVDERGGPAVNFTFNTRGATLFGRLTRANQPNRVTNFYHYLGIVLDDELRTAPRLNDVITQHGQISGNFTKEEVEFIISILNAGSLPAALNKTPISEDIVSATLGADTVRQGGQAIAISMVMVLIFMLVYYRFAGIVANLALLANLVLILAVMIMIKAAFTLPGLAGLVLTVGMAVDANVLIFERIREELGHGAALRMAIRNGFSRATRTIVDANLTTLITAIVLYWIGTDQIRGFAVTLILGILMSMYTAIFCSRIIFDIAEKKRWITDLKMMRMLSHTNIDFLGKRYVAATVSIVAILIGLVAVYGRGQGLLDIDFTGGTSVTILLNEDSPMDIAAVRQAVTEPLELESELESELEDVAVVGVGNQNLLYRINTRDRDIEKVEARLESIFGDKLRLNSLSHGELKLVAGSADDAAKPGSETADKERYAGGTETALTIGEPIKRDTLVERLEDALTEANKPGTLFDVTNPDYIPGSDIRFHNWELKIALDPATTEPILEAMNKQLSAKPVFPSSSNIGGQVAGDTQAQAGYALFASLLFIVAYIWLRFQRIMFGLAAVVALIHDVLITLGVLAMSGYIVSYLPPVATALLLDPFKISLPIVAAFLTIIGYSLNDTIVVFDRIREVRGKSPDLTAKMINTSINQTLSRTILTSLTTLLVVVILYVIGGSGIHGFAFALVVGVLIGTYSSIFVASPVLLWMSQAGEPAPGRQNKTSPHGGVTREIRARRRPPDLAKTAGPRL